MSHPYQCLVAGSSGDGLAQNKLFAASGPYIVSVSLKTGELLSSWPKDICNTQNVNEYITEDAEPPEKRRKLEEESELSSITELLISPDGSYLIAVTDDKCLRVLQISGDGSLAQLSQRSMPKKPCVVELDSNNSTIFCGDKFGDVYSVPLLAPAEDLDSTASIGEVPEHKPFMPSASILTVHSGRNRKVLEDQIRQAQKPPEKPSKEPLKFKHELVLGHVSMLTAVVFASVVDDSSGKSRQYLLTSDRDEHIRVSRCPPQSHVIEGYCMGHEEFVSKLALLTPKILVSGGGDDYLCLWDWRSFKVLTKIDIRESLDGTETEAGEARRIAVTCIRIMDGPRQSFKLILVALEETDVLLSWTVSMENLETVANSPLRLRANLLDIVIISNSEIVVSVHSQVGGDKLKGNGQGKADEARLLAYSVGYSQDGQGAEWALSDGMPVSLEKANGLWTSDADDKAVRRLLYSTETLRKRSGAED